MVFAKLETNVPRKTRVLFLFDSWFSTRKTLGDGTLTQKMSLDHLSWEIHQDDSRISPLLLCGFVTELY